MRDTWKRTWNDLFANKHLEPRELVVYGAQTTGLRLELFALDVVFSDVYRFYSLGTFSLPQSLDDFNALFGFLGMTLALRVLLEKQLELRKKAANTRERSPEQLRVAESDTFGTPKRGDPGAGGGSGRGPGGGGKKDTGGRNPSGSGGQSDTTSRGGHAKSDHGSKRGFEGPSSMEEHRNIGPTDDDNYPVQKYIYPNIGGLTAVYFSRTKLGRDVAVKEFRLEGGKRWKKELRMLLLAHGARVPHVVSLIDYYVPQSGYSRMDTLAVLVFPRLEPVEIDGFALSLNEKVRLFKQLIIALEGLHSLSIVHRDIKPSNLMLDPVTRDLTLIDFDLSAFYCPLDDETRDFSGTEGFIAPETEKEGLFGPWSDIYGAGLVLLRALMGHLLPTTVVNDLLSEWDCGEDAEDVVHRIRIEAKRHLHQRSAPVKNTITVDKEGLAIELGCELGIEMTRRDPFRRPTATQILQHPFVASARASTGVNKRVVNRKSKKGVLLRNPLFASLPATLLGDDEKENVFQN
jgi:serine/threonine protein kinase